MKTTLSFLLLTAFCLSTAISFAQKRENPNPYAIFGSKPFIAGEERGKEPVKVFVIENMAEGSKVARLEHNTETRVVTSFDKKGNAILKKKLKEGERAWLTQDRFAEKYYSHSPYSYAVGNPVRYIDVNGDSVNISGAEQQAAYDQLVQRLGGELNMTLRDDGTIIASPREGVKQSRAAKQAMKAFGSATITVNIVAENTKETSTGNLYIGGAFMGNTVTQNADGTISVVATQEVNPGVLGKLSNAYGKPGQDMLHEVTEGYQGGLISQRNGVSSPNSGSPNSVYPDAHNAAVPQSGGFREVMYDWNGRPVPDGQRRNISHNSVRYIATPKNQPSVTIMTYP